MGEIRKIPQEEEPHWPTSTPLTIAQVLRQADQQVTLGQMEDYVPLPMGFDQIDRVVGGGLMRGDLILLGGAQGIGKTMFALQAARNLAANEKIYAFYVSYEHPETHLLHRLLCMESIDLNSQEYQHGLRMRDLRNVVLTKRTGEARSQGLYQILQGHTLARNSLKKIAEYANRLIVMKGNPISTNLQSLRSLAHRLVTTCEGNVVLFVDYLQKVSVEPIKTVDENDKVTIVVEGLKDLALSLNIPVFAIVAAGREGLRAKRLHLHHLRGSSALDYECDVAIIMNNKYYIVSRDHIAFDPYKAESYRNWIVFTVEKNRAGKAMIDVEFELRSEYFCFNPLGSIVEQRLIDEKLVYE
ncbi:MAG: AAA family ATPase [Chloroflexia bacterium]|nr:AAA family ATPase [Chloroflexia bacterium]